MFVFYLLQCLHSSYFDNQEALGLLAAFWGQYLQSVSRVNAALVYGLFATKFWSEERHIRLQLC